MGYNEIRSIRVFVFMGCVMKSVLLVDSNKISILMTAEACRDVIPKARVQVAHSGNEALERLKEESFDFMVVDFDLPDCDGVSFIREVKKTFSMPMFLTAFPDSVVLRALKTELYWYEDASRLIPKPVEMKQLKTVISSFIFQDKKLLKEFKPELVASLSRQKKKSQGIDTEVLKMNLKGVSLQYVKQTLFSKIILPKTVLCYKV